jgi:hypothetical protein
VEVEGEIYEAIPADLIVRAGLLAASELLGGKTDTSCCPQENVCPPGQVAAQPQIFSLESLVMGKNLVVTITDGEFIRMKSAVLDKDGEEALKLLKELIKRLEQQENLGLKSHLG